MPVSFSSPPRNLFLLGSSGADVVTNFFKSVDQSTSSEDVYRPEQIKYDEVNDKYFFAGTADDKSTNKELGWIERRTYDGSTNPATSPKDWDIKIQNLSHSTGDTRLRAMEWYEGDGLYVVGSQGGVLPWIAHYSTDGQIQWQTSTNTALVEYTGVAKSSMGVFACGYTDTFSYALHTQAFIEKFDQYGNAGWGKAAYMLGRDVVLTKLSVNDKGEVIAVGYLEDDSADKGYIVKMDGNTGEIIWDRTLERNISGSGGTGPNDSDDCSPANVRCTACHIDGNNQIYIVGTINGNSPILTGTGEFIVKYSPEGNILWQRENNTDQWDGNVDPNAPYVIPYSVESDTETQQTVVLSVDKPDGFGANNADVLISKYSRDGSLVFRRKISKGTDNLGNASLDADASFYYILFRDQTIDYVGGEPDRYTFGKVSTSGNGLGDFSYDDYTGTDVDYTIVANAENKIGRLSDGSIRNDTSDLITYPFTANKLVFDDLATPVSNKRRQMDSADSFEYSGSPAIRPTDFSDVNLIASDYSGTGNWIDKSKNGYDGLLVGSVGPTYQGDYFEISTNKRIELNDFDVSNKTSFSIEAWVKFDSLTSQATSSGYIWDQSASNSGISLRVKPTAGTSKDLEIVLHYSLTGTYLITANPVSAGTWYHTITSFDATNNVVSLYVDGDGFGSSNLGWSQVQALQQDLPFTIGASAQTLGVSAGEAEFLTPGQYVFNIPTGLTSLSAVLVGGGGGGSATTNYSSGVSGGGGGGGALSWINGADVSGQTQLYITVGQGGAGGTQAGLDNATDGGDSYIRTGSHSGTIIARAGGGGKGKYGGPQVIQNGGVNYSGTYTGTGSGGGTGGRGGRGQSGHQSGGGGGAGGYEGDGGQGSDGTQNNRTSGSGGGGGGGGSVNSTSNHRVQVGGGGVGLWGSGVAGGSGSSPESGNTTAELADAQGFAGSGGTSKDPSTSSREKAYGGGGTGNEDDGRNGAADAGSGGVRVLWGTSRSFPNVNVGLNTDGGAEDGPSYDSNASVGGSSLTASDWSHYIGKYRDCQDGGFKLYSSGNASVNDFFMGCWVKFNTYETGRRIGIELYMANEMIYLETKANGAIAVKHHAGTESTSSATDLDDGGWHYIALSVNSGTLTGFVDGVVEVSTTSGVSGTSVGGNTNFGFFASGINDDFNADVRVLDVLIGLDVGTSGGFSLNKPLIDANFAATNGSNASGPFFSNDFVYQSPAIALNGNTSDYNYKTGTGITWTYNEYGTLVEGGTGGSSSDSREYMDGDIGEFRIYNRYLNQTQARQNYNATKTKYHNERVDVAPTIGPGIIQNTYMMTHYDFGNRACFDTAENLFKDNRVVDLVDYNSTANGKWSMTPGNTGSTVGPNVMSPVGDFTAGTIVYDGSDASVGGIAWAYKDTSLSTSNQMQFAEGDTVTLSVFAKIGSSNKIVKSIYLRAYDPEAGYWFNLETGTAAATASENVMSIYAETIDSYGNGWYKCTLTFAIGSNDEIGFQLYLANSGGGTGFNSSDGAGDTIHIWNPQVQRVHTYNDGRASRPIQTYGTAITQSTTVKTLYEPGNNWNASLVNGQSIHNPREGVIWFFDNAAGQPAYLDVGTGGYDNINLTEADGWTIELWLKVQDPSSGNYANNAWNYFWRDSATGSSPAFESGIYSDNNTNFAFKDNDTANTQISMTMTPNKWHWIAFGISGTGVTKMMYSDENGTFNTTNSGVAAASGPCAIDKFFVHPNGTSPLRCICGEIRVYNRELLTPEGTVNYNATRNKYGV